MGISEESDLRNLRFAVRGAARATEKPRGPENELAPGDIDPALGCRGAPRNRATANSLSSYPFAELASAPPRGRGARGGALLCFA